MTSPQTKQDPMAQLDAAMNETFQELAQQGRGTSDSEVMRQAPRRQRTQRPQRQAAPEDEAPWFADDQPQQQEQSQPRRKLRPRGPDPAEAILEEAETEDTDERARRRRGPERDDRGRFLPSRDTDDRDEDEADESDEDDEDETPARAGGRRYRETEEADLEDDEVESEGRPRAEDEDDEEPRSRGRGRRRFPRAVRDEIDRQVKEQVARVVAENDKLREQQRAQELTDNQAMEFLLQAVGTQEQRNQLQATVNNTRLPLERRNQAAAILNRYLSNEQYARKYGQALAAMQRKEVTRKRQDGVTKLSQYQVQLDPQIVYGADESAMLMHVADAAIKAYIRQQRAGRDTGRRQAATRNGMADERAVRGGSFGRDSLASSNGRRANGRVARTDPLRRAMTNSRGVAPGSTLPAPTDDVLKQLRNGDITFRDLGFR